MKEENTSQDTNINNDHISQDQEYIENHSIENSSTEDNPVENISIENNLVENQDMGLEESIETKENKEEENIESNTQNENTSEKISSTQTSSVETQLENTQGRWYILHTYSGFEQRVVQTINEMMRLGQDEGLVHEVIVPTEKVIEIDKGGKKRTTTKKFYPGYVMVRMTMTDYSWHLVQNIPKVTGFIGGKNRPAPMRPSEANKILSLMQERQEQPRSKFNFAKGDIVKVLDGPFAGFDAVVEDVNEDKGKLKASISIFGRQTAVDLDFVQIAQPT